MTNFDEKAFLYALAARPEDAKRFAVTFKPEWLHTTEYIPILAELYAFTRKHGQQPSISTLHEIFKDKDEEAYNLRYKDVLNSITEEVPDQSKVLYTLDKAKETGVVRDFQELANDQSFLKQQAGLEGFNILKGLHKFLTRHGDTKGDRTMDLKEAIDHLIDNHGFTPELVRIPCGIHIIDKWTGGGLRTKQLGIIMAPTGDGKSSMLVNMAFNMSTTEQARVWVVTNELSIEEQTERILSRLTGKEVGKIIDDPGIAYTGLDRHWKSGLHDRMRITECNREVTTDDLEAEMAKWSNLIGWKPDVLILDFIERMRPNERGYSRDRPWDWLGAISVDLSRLAKRHNILIWTAAQTNRSGYAKAKGKQPLSLEMAQSSVKHLQEAAAIIAMRQVYLPGDKIVLELADLKQRFSKRSAKSHFLEVDLGKMSITNEEWVKPDAKEDTSDYVEPEVMKTELLTPAEKQEEKQKRERNRS